MHCVGKKCKPHCQHDEFLCDDQLRCINTNYTCDDFSDCDDDSDEKNCRKYSPRIIILFLHLLLRLLRSHGLQPRELHLVARATTVASMLYAAPAWWGFAGEGDRQRLERLIARMRRSGYLPSDFPDLATLVEEADCKLYTNLRRSNTHVLRHYFIENTHSSAPREGSQLCPSTQRQ